MPIENHDDLIPIEPDALLWRYMNISKFLSLLKTKSIFFCRSDMFIDPFEGTIPKKEVEARPHTYQQICKFFNIQFRPEKFNEVESKKIDFHKRTRMGTVINCWHIGNYESDTMWRLYLKTTEGVAIQSSPQHIFNSFQETQEPIYSSKVRYLDYDNDIWYHPTDYPIELENSLTPFVHKRIEFSSESEFRLFHNVNDVIFYQGENYWENQKNHFGKFIKVNVNELIEKVVFSPAMNEVDQQKIKFKVKELGYNFDLHKSKLKQAPYL